ncbi:LysE family transporter [Fluoribacter dumoffii]|uniref:Threonine efflux protein n=1 Tax=Fluoribacter dumoffii TaxID=463 RepID=A0A377G6C8_9GAMM|nr:LysE family transporter [Fluoribacter dumoffii]KTC92413.1 lysE family transporter protein [Fluoribacter dumoffii NY 23]MCW8386989.1 LysE family transporter [Fluoribacter dumoffii]MCW8417508.1 LysE family transporter [Fluoribacter dumoffii]MCW8454650.1 LysE family transporter [Fluoribacter dumoffii]MCW8461272.1 LysE family transporter [Fluoribacter dumoffii]
MQEFLSISVLIMLAAISPGPDFALVTKNSLLYSRKAGIYTALGVSVSLLAHASYCILGLALVISQSLLAFSIIKYLGAAYLIYIGIKSLLAKREMMKVDTRQATHSITSLQAFNQGLFCNLLNPKAIMFLLAFFTLVVKPGHSIITELGYGVEIALIHMIWFSSLSYLLTHQYVKSNLNRLQYYIVKVMGGLLVAFGVRIANLSHAAMLPA